MKLQQTFVSLVVCRQGREMVICYPATWLSLQSADGIAVAQSRPSSLRCPGERGCLLRTESKASNHRVRGYGSIGRCTRRRRWGIDCTINLKRQRMNASYCAVPWGCAVPGRNVRGAVWGHRPVTTVAVVGVAGIFCSCLFPLYKGVRVDTAINICSL